MTSEPKWPPLRLSLMALIVALGSSFSFGFQLLITNPAQGAFINFLNASKNSRNAERTDFSELENEWSFIVAIFFFGSASGAFLIRSVAKRFGRKNGIAVSVVTQCISSVLSIASFMITNHVLFTFARFLMGVGITVSMGLSAMFVTEASPAYCRGVSSLINGVILQLSISVGAVMAMPKLLGNDSYWWTLYFFQLVINLVVLCLLPLLHESPGELATRNKLEETVDSIQFYHGISRDASEKLAADLLESHQNFKSQDSILSVWKSPFNRRGILVGMAVMFSMALSGITVINAFAFEILMNAGLDQDTAAVANVAVCLFSFGGIVVSTKIIDRFGRRPLLISTFASLGVVNAAIAGLMYAHFITENHLVAHLLISAICLFNFLFAMGPGPMAIFITGELVSHNSRSASSVWTNAVMAIVRFLILTFYIPFKNSTSECTAYATFFIIPMIAAVFILFFTLPETKGRNVEEIRKEYETKALLLLQ